MKMKFKYLFLLFSLPFLTVIGNEQITDAQDMPRLTVENPLKGFSDFILISMVPASSKPQADKMNALVEKELNKYGKVSKIGLLVKTDQGEAIDFREFNADSLIYEIKNVTAPDGKELPFVRATLNLRSHVLIDKTKQDYSPYIWSGDCFLPGKTQKDLEKLVSQSLSCLLQKFSENYSVANADKPLFKLYTP